MKRCVLLMVLLAPTFAQAQTPTPEASPAATASPVATAEPAETPEPQPTPAAPSTPLTWSAKPSGMIAFVGGFNDRGVNTIDLPTQATGTDVKSLGATARGTRIGLNVSTVGGTPLPEGMKISGTIEGDFFGGLPGQGLGDVSPIFRLRHANVKADWGRCWLLAGQTWSVFAPRHPTSVARTFLPAFNGSGNLWNREPMVAAGASFGPASIALAAVAPVDPAAPGGAPFSQTNLAGPGELSAAPAGEGRLAVATKLLDSGLVVEGAVSGRYGTERIAVDGDAIPSNGVALDGKIAWGSLIWVQGEAFQGENLDSYFALDGTEVDIVGMSPVLQAVAIPTSGGWVQVGGGWRRVEVSFAYGEQTLDEEWMGSGNGIRQNQTWTAQLTFRPSKGLAVGLEYDYIETARRASATSFDDAIARHYDLAVQLSF